jgi:hypothetical protein
MVFGTLLTTALAFASRAMWLVSFPLIDYGWSRYITQASPHGCHVQRMLASDMANPLEVLLRLGRNFNDFLEVFLTLRSSSAS